MPRRLIRWGFYLVGLATGLVAAIVVIFAAQARLRLPDLRPWHTLVLDGEYRTGRSGSPSTFPEYLKLEDRLIAETRRRILDDPAAADPHALGRYNPKSPPGRLALTTPYNRSYELVPAEPRGAVLLVHGLSDSPYSMRALAELFFRHGYYVLVLRLPGHGMVPASLKDVSWEDWYGAVALAARHAAAQAGPGRPFLAGGHSTGAALLTLYAVRATADESLPRPEALYLVSPAIGISPFAVLTSVISALSFVPGLEKSAWIDVLPEYDPYKFNSFPVNAANQISSLTRVVQRALDGAAKEGRLGKMPRVTVFQSLVDSTVTAPEVIHGLLGRLPPSKGNELVVFDVNRSELLLGLLAPGPLESMERLRNADGLPFRLTIVGNRSETEAGVALYTREEGAKEMSREELPLAWPRGVFSLGHVALPFPPDDPVYGIDPAPVGPVYFNLGSVALRGESGALLVSLGAFSRLRSNPFFDVLRLRIEATLPQAAPEAR